jgi:hypothetical protein
VIQRDLEVLTAWARQHGWLPIWPASDNRLRIGKDKVEICPAVVMDPSQLGTCSGPWHLDHVQDPSNPMKGVKAPDEMDHLVSLCAAHDERGMRAGHQWNTAHRQAEWDYLRERRHERPGGGGDRA